MKLLGVGLATTLLAICTLFLYVGPRRERNEEEEKKNY